MLSKLLGPARNGGLREYMLVLLIPFLFTVMGSTLLAVISYVWAIPVLISIYLGVSRDRSGWMWGAFLQWLGVFILACMRPVNR